MSKPRVLVADDDPILLATVADCLDGWGADVVPVESGLDLVAQIAEGSPFDLIVTDVSMPWMTGLQAVHTVRHVGVGTPVIVMTARADASLAASVRALGGAAALLKKPFSIAALKDAAARLLHAPRAPAGSHASG